MSRLVSIPRWLLLVFVGLPFLMSARPVRQSSSALPAIFTVGYTVRDDKQRTFEIIRVDGDWAQVRIVQNGSLFADVQAWVHIPTATVWTRQ